MPEMITTQQIVDTPLGWLVLQGDREHLFRSNWVDEQDLTVGHGTQPAHWKILAAQQIGEYFNGKRSSFSLPIKPIGTNFQQLIWDKILHIPFGNTLDVKELAGIDQVTASMMAVAANPMALIIPCHRIALDASDGQSIASSNKIKDKLLLHEGANHAQQLRLF